MLESSKGLIKTLTNVKMLSFNCEIMTNLMMDLLDLAQLENNSFKLNKVFFSFTDACKQAI